MLASVLTGTMRRDCLSVNGVVKVCSKMAGTPLSSLSHLHKNTAEGGTVRPV